MSTTKPTSCKEAIRMWEEENKQDASTAKEMILSFRWPPIEKMDNSLAVLVNCEKLSLSTNMIEKIAGKRIFSLSFIFIAYCSFFKSLEIEITFEFNNFLFIYFFFNIRVTVWSLNSKNSAIVSNNEIGRANNFT